MTIKEVSEKYGLSRETLRYYESIGVIPNVTRKHNGIRDYSIEDLCWVEFAVEMKSMDLPIETMIQCVTYCINAGFSPQLPNHILQQHKKFLIKKRTEIDDTLGKLNKQISRTILE